MGATHDTLDMEQFRHRYGVERCGEAQLCVEAQVERNQLRFYCTQGRLASTRELTSWGGDAWAYVVGNTEKDLNSYPPPKILSPVSK